MRRKKWMQTEKKGPAKKQREPVKPIPRNHLAVMLKYLRRRKSRLARRNLHVLRMLYYTGLRVGEAARIRIADVLDNNQVVDNLKIRSAIAKGNKERSIPLSVRAGSAISALVDLHKSKNPDDMLIGVGPRQIEIIFTKTSKRCGLPRYHPHQARHAFATSLFRRGVRVPVIQYLLGHSSIKTTMTYLAILDADLRRAVGKI